MSETFDREAALRRLRDLEGEAARLRQALGAQGDRNPSTRAPQQLAMLAEAERIAHVGSWAWVPETGEVTWSEELYRILGYDPSSDRPSTGAFFAVTHPDDLERVRSAAERSVRDRTSSGPIECRIVRRDGSLRYTRSDSVASVDAHGRLCFFGAVADVTDQAHATLALQRATKVLEEVQRFAGLGTWIWDLTTGQLEWSEQLYRIYGLDPALPASFELHAKLVHPEDRANVEAATQRAARGLARPSEYRLITPSGEVRHVYCRSRSVREGDRVVRLVGLTLDVTDRKLLEEQVRHAQKMEALGTLAGGVAHDFNNYLQVITLGTDLARLLLGPGHAALSALADVEAAASRCAALVQRLLAFGRRQPAAPHLIELDAQLASVTPMLRTLVGEAVQLSIAHGARRGTVRIDPLQLEQIVLNLAVNARDAMPNGGLVELRTEVVELTEPQLTSMPGLEPGAYVVLSVRDTGVGIASDVLPRIFDPFFTTKGERGAGLGLPTVYGLVRQNNGAVTVESEPGRGSTFRVFLPFVEGVPETAPDVHDAPTQHAVRVKRSGTVLVVEDGAAVRRATARMLREHGFRTIEAYDAAKALEVLEEQGESVDLLLTDIRMPGMSGLDLAKRVRAVRPRLRVLLMSGYAESLEDVQLPVLAKPFPMQALIERVEATLASS